MSVAPRKRADTPGPQVSPGRRVTRTARRCSSACLPRAPNRTWVADYSWVRRREGSSASAASWTCQVDVWCWGIMKADASRSSRQARHPVLACSQCLADPGIAASRGWVGEAYDNSSIAGLGAPTTRSELLHRWVRPRRHETGMSIFRVDLELVHPQAGCTLLLGYRSPDSSSKSITTSIRDRFTRNRDQLIRCPGYRGGPHPTKVASDPPAAS